MKFKNLSVAVAKQFQSMTATKLFRVTVEKDTLWETYLKSFPEGSNPIYLKRTEHDCSCCRSFIRMLGGVVTIRDGALVSIWDAAVEDGYQAVVDAMAALVKAAAIDNLFLHAEKTIGTAASRQLLEDKTVKTWEHFFVNLPAAVVLKKDLIGPRLSEHRSTHDVMLRALEEIPVEAIDTVLELIAQNSLYRGEEHTFALTEFRKLKVAFAQLAGAAEKDRFVWTSIETVQSVSRIRNTVIGTLLADLAEERNLEDAVRAFEAKVAPANYKRPTALISKRMIADAQAKVEELGLASALDRRYATIEDVTINNILFADRSVKKAMNVFDSLAWRVPESAQKLDRVEEVTIDQFLATVLPKADSVEVMLENRHAGNLVSLITACDPTAKQLFKWPNPFSWSYAGELTDSIKERVKNAGGCVEADLRCSLSWRNYDDLDLHLTEPGGNEIYYANKHSLTGGQLDVDMNAGAGTTRSAVENIFFPSRGRMLEGTYRLAVHNFCLRETVDVGFESEIEFDGATHSFSYPKAVRDKELISVATFTYSRKEGLKLLDSLPSAPISRMLWSIPTQAFHRVNAVMLSPNHWDERAIGNRHYFFMLDGCLNEGKSRGFFNEFLTEDLAKHRKVFEVVGARMRTDESSRQLSGLGFSSTQRNHVLCRIRGAFTRTVKLTF